MLQNFRVTAFVISELLTENQQGVKSHLRLGLKAVKSSKLRSIHRKTHVLESLFKKAADLNAYIYIKKRLKLGCFLENIAKFLGTPILKNICERLLLKWQRY